MSEPPLFLILHKVRGEPAFDVAQELEIGDEWGWIIPTSGHRAYPYWSLPFERVQTGDIPEIPDDWPDHYAVGAEPPPARGSVRGLLAAIGLGPRALKRRALR